MESAQLRFRGFSASKIDAARKQPDTYSYGQRDGGVVLESDIGDVYDGMGMFGSW